ncbi:MAG: hypothetical protein GY941_29935 [Planctomycetes bacterium]|nr:hypothetical protein [Planctomycetota bacterium]
MNTVNTYLRGLTLLTDPVEQFDEAWGKLSAEYKSEITPPENIISFRCEARKIVSS